MASRPKRRCNGCKQIVSGRCPKCARERDGIRQQQRGPRLYDERAWRRLSQQYRRINPLCDECEKHGRTALAEEVHHKIDVKDAPDLAYDFDNLIGLCKPCHSKITGGSR